jgi:transcriptional regulator with XRE-family HTH domain
MDDVHIGTVLRVIRTRTGLRQSDVARRAGVRREVVGRLERGALGRIQLDTSRAIATALGVNLDIRARWRGGDLDRVVNEAHARLHEELGRHLGTLKGWTWRAEVSFSIYGERGVIDILAWHAESRSLLIIELKTAVVDPQGLVESMGRRVRLGPRIAAQFGWQPATVSAWIVVLDTRTNHRRVLRSSTLLRSAFPADGHQMRSWMLLPAGSIHSLSYWTDVRPDARRRPSGHRDRVRARRPRADASVTERG